MGKHENHDKGNAGEELAASFLKDKGAEIIQRNFRSRSGEIDIIFKDGNYLVFAEVKERAGNLYGSPFDAITPAKCKRIRNAAKYYLYINGYPESTYVRFDALGIVDGSITWLKNAF